MLYSTTIALVAFSLLLGGCSAGGDRNLSPGPRSDTVAGSPETPPLQVVTTNTVLADLVRNVGGELVAVTSLIPPGADVHTFQTSPSDSITIGAADLIFSNGAGLDDFLVPVLAGARKPGVVQIIASEGLELPQDLDGPADSGTNNPGNEPLDRDAHFWMDPTLTIQYVERIVEGLTRTDPDNAQQYSVNGQAYIDELRRLDEEIARTLAQVPPDRRRLVTFHDAYSHFARRYGWQTAAFVPSDASDVTPGDIVAVMEQLGQDGIPAVFAEPELKSDVLMQAARDAGVAVGTIRSLVDDQALTYIDMMRTNASSLVQDLE